MIAGTLYEHTDIPPGMTCDDYRRRRSSDERPRGLAQCVTLALLYPARMLAHLTEPGPAVGTHQAALHVSSELSGASRGRTA